MNKTFGLAILALLLLGCRAPAPPLATPTPAPADTQVIRGVVNAGPTCPVETIPPDPNCADRPVAGAELWVLDDDIMVRRTTSAADGSFELALPPGSYQLYPQPVEGLMGTAPMQEIQIDVGVPHPELVISYDTGIR